MQNQPNIHNFGGFPQTLFHGQDPAPGIPQLAIQTKNIVTKTKVGLDHKWAMKEENEKIS